MGQVAFWGIQDGLGVTSNVAAVASILALEYQIKTLVSQPQWSEATLEYAFRSSITRYNRDFMNFAIQGLDSLDRAVRSNKLERESIKNNSLLIEPDRLDFLQGSTKLNKEEFEGSHGIIQTIFQKADEYYEAVLLDVQSGENSQVTQALMKQSELIVVCVNQNISILEQYFNERTNWPSFLREKPQIVLIGQYDQSSKYKLRNIINKYRFKGRIFPISYNTDFRDHFNDGDVKGFFSKYRGVGKRDENYVFIDEVRTAARSILEEIGVNTQIKHIERGAS
ncbi:hypothetical protein RB298_04870 [Priestia sp. BR_2]